jgi:hypothetical protein
MPRRGLSVALAAYVLLSGVGLAAFELRGRESRAQALELAARAELVKDWLRRAKQPLGSDWVAAQGLALEEITPRQPVEWLPKGHRLFAIRDTRPVASAVTVRPSGAAHWLVVDADGRFLRFEPGSER